METGDLSQFPNGFSNNGGASSRISTGGEPVLQGNWSMAMTSPGGGSGTRARIDGNNFGQADPHKNIPDEHWFVANYHIPVHVDMNNNDSWNIMQGKQTYNTGSGQSRHATWSIRPWERNGNSYGFQFKTRISQSNGAWADSNNFRPIQYDGPLNVAAGQWFQFAVHTRYSDTGNGFWRVFLNGTLAGEVLNAYTEVSMQTHDGANFNIPSNWWKRQITVNNYPSANHDPRPHTIFVDDVGVYLPA